MIRSLPAGDALEVWILIAAERQKLGIGGHALDPGKRLLRKGPIVAAIHAENCVSIGMFEMGGYRAAGAVSEFGAGASA